MAGFVATEAVEALDYDFTGYGGTKGTIPEPTTAHLDRFFEAVQGLSTRVGVGPDASAEEVAQAVAKISKRDAAEFTNQIKAAIVGLCGGSPSQEDVDVLPYRVLMAFLGWLMEALRPEARTPGTRG